MSTLKNNEQNEKEINLNKWTVYIHINKSNQKKYVGITSRKPTVRWKRNGEGYKSSPYFYNAIKKHGWDNFEHNILWGMSRTPVALAMRGSIKKKYIMENVKNSHQ